MIEDATAMKKLTRLANEGLARRLHPVVED